MNQNKSLDTNKLETTKSTIKISGINEINLVSIDAQILSMGGFIIKRLDALDEIEKTNNRDENEIVINKLFEIFSSKLVDLNNVLKKVTDQELLDKANKRLEALIIIVINLLTYKSILKNVKVQKKN
jgi:hypothetical protein